MPVVLRGGLRLFVRLYGLIHFSNSLDLYSSSFWTLKPKSYWSHLVCWPNCANISFGFELCLTEVVPLDSAQNSGLVELKNHRNRTSIEVYRPCFLFSMRKNKCSRGSAGDHSSDSASARGPIFLRIFLPFTENGAVSPGTHANPVVLDIIWVGILRRMWWYSRIVIIVKTERDIAWESWWFAMSYSLLYLSLLPPWLQLCYSIIHTTACLLTVSTEVQI